MANIPESAHHGIATAILEPNGTIFPKHKAAGLTSASIELQWTNLDTATTGTTPSYSSSAVSAMQTQITNATAAGLDCTLDFGVHYPAAWVLALPNAKFVDQWGNTWTGTAGGGTANGDAVVNGIWNSAVRTAIANYIQWVFQTFGTNFSCIRWGGAGPTGETGYPGSAGDARGFSFWCYDPNAQNTALSLGSPAVTGVPSALAGLHPGTSGNNTIGSIANATNFITWYYTSLQNFVIWGVQQIRQYYKGPIQLLFPSYGTRKTWAGEGWDYNTGDDLVDMTYTTPPINCTNGAATTGGGRPNAYRMDQIARGHAWHMQIPQYLNPSNYGGVDPSPLIAHSTWADDTDYYGDPTNWCNPHYIAYLLSKNPGMGYSGENTAAVPSYKQIRTMYTNLMKWSEAWCPGRLVRAYVLSEAGLFDRSGNTSNVSLQEIGRLARKTTNNHFAGHLAQSGTLQTGKNVNGGVGSANSTNPPASVTIDPDATDTRGMVTLTTVSGTAGDAVQILFETSYLARPIITLTPADANTAKAQPYCYEFLDGNTSTYTYFIIGFANPTAGQTYKLRWHTIG